MSNSYFNANSVPVTLSRGASSTIRSEFSLVATGFDMLPTPAQVWGGSMNYVAAGGSQNAWTATVATSYLATYADGLTIRVKFAAANSTTTPTLNLNGLGAKTIVRDSGVALAVSDITAGMIATLTYNSTYGKWQLVQSPVGTATDINAANLAASSGTTLVGYINAGTGAVLRTVQSRLREKVYAKDYGAVGDGVTNDLSAVQAAVDANPGRIIDLGDGTFKFVGRLRVTTEGTELQGAGLSKTKIIQYAADVDTILFEPTTAGSSSVMLGQVGISGIHVTHDSSVGATNPTTGAAIRFRQCSRFRLFNCWVEDAAEGLTIEGGQLGSIKTLRGRTNASVGSYLGLETAIVHFRQASIGSGQYQPCYTMEIDDFHLTAGLMRGSCIRIANADGMNYGNGYCSGGYDSLVRIKADREAGFTDIFGTVHYSYVAAVSFADVYLDCVGTDWTNNGVVIPDDGFANTTVFDVTIGSGCTIGNGDESGLVLRKTRTNHIIFNGAKIINMGLWAADIEGGASRTEVVWNGGYVSNVGDVSTGAIRLAGSMLGFTMSGVSFRGVETTVVKFEGTIDRATITGCPHHDDTADITITGTVGTLALAGNVSSWTGSAANSWTGVKPARTIDGQSFDFRSNITVIAPATVAATAKTTPVDADLLPMVDSAASNVLKKLTWANAKATLQTTFDARYLNADNINGGTLADARLPTTQSGKIFTSSVVFEGAVPSTYWRETDGVADQRMYGATVENGNWRLQEVNDAFSLVANRITIERGVGGSLHGVWSIDGSLRRDYAAVAAAAIDLATADYFSKTISGPTTFTISNAPTAGTYAEFKLELTNPGTNVTWWSGVKWAGGVAPTLTATGKDLLTFFTRDGGTTWYGRVDGLAFA